MGFFGFGRGGQEGLHRRPEEGGHGLVAQRVQVVVDVAVETFAGFGSGSERRQRVEGRKAQSLHFGGEEAVGLVEVYGVAGDIEHLNGDGASLSWRAAS